MNASTVVHDACEKGEVEVVKGWLLAAVGIQINERGASGWTPLRGACENGHVRVVHVSFTRGEGGSDTTVGGVLEGSFEGCPGVLLTN